MTREDYDSYDAIKLQRQQEGAEQRAASTAVWRDAQVLAHQHGLILRRHTDHHYGLSARDGWLINLYPGNQRVYSAPNRLGCGQCGDCQARRIGGRPMIAANTLRELWDVNQ